MAGNHITGNCTDKECYPAPEECPDGYTLRCCADEPEFPVVPSGPYNCVLSGEINDIRVTRDVINPNYWKKVSTSTTNFSLVVMDNNFNTIASASAVIYNKGLSVIINDKVYYYNYGLSAAAWAFYYLDITTNVVSFVKSQPNIRTSGPFNLNYVNEISTDGQRICTSGYYYVSGAAGYGAYVANTLGEYVDHISAATNSVVMIIHDHYLVSTPTSTTVARYDINKTYIGELSTPDADNSIGRKMIDLGDDGGIGRIAISHTDKVYLFDYSFNLVQTITSPLGVTGSFGVVYDGSSLTNWTYENASAVTFSIARYGNFIVIGDATQNIGGKASGGMYYYDLDGNFVSIALSPSWSLIPTNAGIGGAIILTDTILEGWGPRGSYGSSNRDFLCEL